MSAPTTPITLPGASRALLSAARRGNGSEGAPTLHEYRLQGAEAAERLRARPRPR